MPQQPGSHSAAIQPAPAGYQAPTVEVIPTAPVAPEWTPELVFTTSIQLPDNAGMSLLVMRDGTLKTEIYAASSVSVEVSATGAVRSLIKRTLDYRRCWDGLDSASLLDATLPLMSALVAREAVLTDDRRLLRDFSNRVFGLWSGWDEAVGTALLSNWTAPLDTGGQLASDAVQGLKQEIKKTHQHLQPLWRRRTRHGRVLSLDANLGDGLSLHDLIAADIAPLTHTTGRIFQDQRLNTVLRSLSPTEQQVLFAYAQGEATTWTEAAATTGAPNPEALGERIRRKTKRLATEHQRRASLRMAQAFRSSEQ